MNAIPEDLAALTDHPLVRTTAGNIVQMLVGKPPNPYYQDAGDDPEEDEEVEPDRDGKDASGYGKYPGAKGAIAAMTDQAPKHLTPTVQQILNGHVAWYNPEELLK